MKIKGFFVIPLIAILIAMFTIGAVPGTAVNTSAEEITSTVSDTLTFVYPTMPETSSLEEEVVGFVSNNFGGVIGEASGPTKSIASMFANILETIKGYLEKLLGLLESSGDALGSGNLLGNLGGGILG